VRVLCTSFGFTNEQYHLGSIYGTYGYRGADSCNLFRLPPFSIAEIEKRFTADFSLLLLFDTIQIDRQTIWTLENPDESWILKQNRKEAKDGLPTNIPDEWVRQAYESLHRSLIRLQDEGFIEIVDCNGILRPQQEKLDQMLSDDLESLRCWIEPLRESMAIWQQYTKAVRTFLYNPDDETKGNAYVKGFDSVELYDLRSCIHNQSCISGGLSFLLKALENRDEDCDDSGRYEAQARHSFSDYLRYVNASIVLSASLGSALHDWSDYLPLYQAKIRMIHRAAPHARTDNNEPHKLFSLILPRFSGLDDKKLLSILKDSRIRELRQSIDKAVAENCLMDEEFVHTILRDVIEDQYRFGCSKKVEGYVTAPLHCMQPVGALEKSVEQTAGGAPYSEQRHNGPPWFYLSAENIFSGRNCAWYRSLAPWSRRRPVDLSLL
jgi:hypothetical protein